MYIYIYIYVCSQVQKSDKRFTKLSCGSKIRQKSRPDGKFDEFIMC